MRRGLTVAATAVAFGSTLAAPPARAATGVVLVGHFRYVPGWRGCYPYYCCPSGSGGYTQRCLGTGRLEAVGTHLGTVDVEFEYEEPPGSVMCLLSGAIAGTMSGAVNGYFHWSRVGANVFGTVYFADGTTASLTAQAVFPDPRNACGGTTPVDMRVAIQLSGA